MEYVQIEDLTVTLLQEGFSKQNKDVPGLPSPLFAV